MVLPCAVAAKLAGSYHSSLLLGEQKRKKNLDAESWPKAVHLPARLPSDSRAPVRATPGLGRAFPFRYVLLPPSAPPPSVGATRFRVVWAPMGQWPCVHSPLQLSQGLSVAPAKAQRAPRGPRPQCLLREGSQELLQGPLLWVMFWLWGDFSNVPKRCGRRRRIF